MHIKSIQVILFSTFSALINGIEVSVIFCLFTQSMLNLKQISTKHWLIENIKHKATHTDCDCFH